MLIFDSIPVRVALFAEWDSDLPGGLATTIAGLLDHLPNDIRIIPHIARPGLSTLLRINEVVKCVQQHSIDLVHIATSRPTALAALVAAARLKLPVVGSFDLDFLSATAVRRKYLRVLASLCNNVLVSSSCARDTLRTVAGFDTVALWRPGVDIETFTPEKRSTNLRERWEVSQSRAAVIYAGRLSDEYGAHRLLSLEPALRRSHPIHRLIVAGEGPALPELRYRCDHAVFLGHVPDSQMPELLASADLFVSPSERQSTYHAVLEAQASGLPVVVMARGAAPERVGRDAAVICSCDADFIVHTAALVRTDARRVAMGRAARAHAVVQQWDSGLALIYAEYRRVAQSSRSVRPEVVDVIREQGINS